MMFMIIDIYYFDIWCNLDILAIISETCKDEGISCDVVVDYNDNAHCIDLISSLVSTIKRRIVEKNAIFRCLKISKMLFYHIIWSLCY